MIEVAILGATGTVGQKFISLLQEHPHFSIDELVASERSAGKKYSDACNWLQTHPIPTDIAEIEIKDLYTPLKSRVLFSGLDSSVADKAETHYAELGHIVISNTKSHRMKDNVPLVIPEVNHSHLLAISKQPYKGAIVTNPNCVTIGLCVALAPLHRKFGIAKIMVHTLQAISGAGYPGVASADILGNVIPYIDGEEEKIIEETNKIFGEYNSTDGFSYADITISAHCNRVPVFDGHTENVSVEFVQKPSKADILNAWQECNEFPQISKLHSAPLMPVHYFEQENRPQPARDIMLEHGMATSVGRLRKCEIFDYKFTLLSHNTIRGAAGCAILNAETMHAMNLL